MGANIIQDGTPTVVDFGTVVEGQPGPTRTFTVRNDGAELLTFGTVQVPAGFVLAEGLTANLIAGESDTFTVQLVTATPGTKSGEVSFATNDPDTDVFNFPVQGTVTTEPAGIIVEPTSGLVTTEAGGMATFSVVLATIPTANVTIALSSSDTTEGTVSPASLTFTPGNALTPRTVTVTGVNDNTADGNVKYTIVTAAATSNDANYRDLSAADVSVTNNDNDTPNIVVTPTRGLVTTEFGGRSTFTVVLTTVPTANVTVALSSSDTTEGTVSPNQLTFTPQNALTPQIVTVEGKTRIRTGRGRDLVELVDTLLTRKSRIFTGRGDDTLRVHDSHFPSDILFDGHLGTDILDAGTGRRPNSNGNLFGRAPRVEFETLLS